MKTIIHLCAFCMLLLAGTFGASAQKNKQPAPTLPEPSGSNVNLCVVKGWPPDKKPVAPEGFEVTKFAEGYQSPRNIYVAPNGDVLVALANKESKGLEKFVDAATGADQTGHNMNSLNTIILFRDADHNGVPELKETFLTGLNLPYGMLIIGDAFYVANTDGVWKYPYKSGQTKISGAGKKILDLPDGAKPEGGGHWTRNLVANAKGTKIYIAVGSLTNVADEGMEKEARRACIIEINPDGSGEKIYADGLRNPVGMDWMPGTNTLYTVVNERDKLGDNLVPDYLTSVKKGGFYGWPYSYFGNHVDERIDKKDRRPDLVERAIVPDVALGSHTAALGLAFYDKKDFPAKFHNGAFIGMHGSWNHSDLVGYKVMFVPFVNGKPGKPEDFLTGFIASKANSTVYGRPVGVAVLQDGSLLVADDAGDVIWRVSVKK